MKFIGSLTHLVFSGRKQVFRHFTIFEPKELIALSSADLAQMALEQSKRPLASRARDGTCLDRANGESGEYGEWIWILQLLGWDALKRRFKHQSCWEWVFDYKYELRIPICEKQLYVTFPAIAGFLHLLISISSGECSSFSMESPQTSKTFVDED